MSSEGFIVVNPRHNNRDLEIYFIAQDGARRKFQTVRPGETCHVDKREVSVSEVARPPRLLACQDGTFVTDKKHSRPKASSRKSSRPL